MAQLVFDGLGVSLDSQTVQSLLESQGLSSEVSTLVSSSMMLDEEDVIQCGKCKRQFNSLPVFLSHKEEHKLGIALSRFHVGLENQLTSDQLSTLHIHTLDTNTPIIVEDGTDILSFSIDHNGSFISTGVDMSSLGQPLILSSPQLVSESELTHNGDSLNIEELPPMHPQIHSSIHEALPSLDDTDPLDDRGQLHETLKNQLDDDLDDRDHLDAGNHFDDRDPLDDREDPLDDRALDDQDPLDDREDHHGDREPLDNGDSLDDKEQLDAQRSHDDLGLLVNELRPMQVKSDKLKCDFCSKAFVKNFDLQQHTRSHTGEKPFQCVVCGRAFSQKSNVKKHMYTHKVWPEGLSHTLPKDPLLILQEEDENHETTIVDRSYVCQYCSTAFANYFELKTHMKTHVGHKVYKCIQRNCSETFLELDLFLLHSRSHSDEVQYRCHMCNKQFLTLADLGIHQYSHTAPPAKVKAPKLSKFFTCAQCKSRFVSPEALNHHKATTDHRFTCSHCGKVFSCERYLRRHLPTHGTAASHTCAQCGKGFRTEQYLNMHRVIHSNVKPHACDRCPSAFNRKDKLRRHVLIHENTKRYKCPFKNYSGCAKEFSRQDKLKAHLLTHGNTKLLPCGTCDRVFNRMNLLRQHEKQHKSSLACADCDTVFKNKTVLANHRCSAVDKNTSIKEQLSESLDNVPTIEIIVVPVSRTEAIASSSNGMYEVTFPSASEGDSILPDQEVPV